MYATLALRGLGVMACSMTLTAYAGQPNPLPFAPVGNNGVPAVSSIPHSALTAPAKVELSIIPKTKHTTNTQVQPAKNMHICPMHPQIKQHEKGSCPICGMDLVLQKLDAHALDALPQVMVNTKAASVMGIQTALVTPKALPTRIDTTGRVAYNEDKSVNFVPRADGWVAHLYTPKEGIAVKKGDKLLEFYAPDILMAQDGYVLSLKSNLTFTGERRDFLDNMAKDKLRLLGMPSEVIEDVTRTTELKQTIPLLAPQDGVITELDVDQGDFVSMDKRFMVIADPHSVWVYADIYEHQLEAVKRLMDATVTSPAFPDKRWEGKIDYIASSLDPVSNTLKVRLVVDMQGDLLKPNMRVDVGFDTTKTEPRLTVPNESLIPIGKNQYRVVKLTSEKAFQPVDVVVGQVGDHETEIITGLTVGDRVVTSGQFLLDAESNLQASFNRM